jgi:hypothetical protein
MTPHFEQTISARAVSAKSPSRRRHALQRTVFSSADGGGSRHDVLATV